jgi:hypothetical protein
MYVEMRRVLDNPPGTRIEAMNREAPIKNIRPRRIG